MLRVERIRDRRVPRDAERVKHFRGWVHDSLTCTVAVTVGVSGCPLEGSTWTHWTVPDAGEVAVMFTKRPVGAVPDAVNPGGGNALTSDHVPVVGGRIVSGDPTAPDALCALFWESGTDWTTEPPVWMPPVWVPPVVPPLGNAAVVGSDM
jgi:hypothetical protein